ncbi:MAG: hypothetical protein JWN86_2128 [Planctomycetota bacterium]|nr:hypothetical protein [Planctomycetota bacterium]
MVGARWSVSARNAVFGVLAGVALSWVAFGRTAPAARAQGPNGVDASGTVAFTSGGNGSAQFLYLIDTKTQAFAIYRVDPQNPKGAVKLEAARQYRWDLKLAEYNNQPPDVASIESMIGSPRK